MHAVSFLSRWLTDYMVIGHRARGEALLRGVDALLRGGKLALTHLGRRRRGTAQVKHHIKAIDRLLGNRYLHDERDGIYQAVAATVLAGHRRPVLLVDWADFEINRQWLMLEAAVPVNGRAITIYEQVFPFRRYNNPSAHREFLAALKRIVPEHRRCRPPKRVCHKQSNVTLYRKIHRAPWLLATNLPYDRLMPRKIKQLYAQRMQIEETLRDMKSHQWGMGLRYARCSSAKRLEILLLIAALAALVQWVCGLHAQALDLARTFQANTVRSRAVLSVVFIGQQFLHRFERPPPDDALEDAFFTLRCLIREASPL